MPKAAIAGLSLILYLLVPAWLLFAEFDQRLAVWVRLGDLERCFASLQQNRAKVARVLVADHCIALNGVGVECRVPQGEALARSLTAWCQAQGVPVLMGLGNYGGGFSRPEIIARMLKNPEQRRQHIQVVLAAVVTLGYSGVDVDYENLPAASRDHFTAFIEELALALRTAGKECDVTVPPKFSSPGWDKTKAYDWMRLPRAAGRVNVMCYDWYLRSGPPGPIIPLGVTQKVIGFIKTRTRPEAFWIGHPAYGNDWLEKKGRSYQGRYAGAATLRRRAREQEAVIRYDSKPLGGFAVGPFAHYTYVAEDGVHHVWFGDRQSLEATRQEVQKENLGGIFIWRAGLEDPGIWDAIPVDQGAGNDAASSATDGVLP
ncbi:hypothetical protein JW933_04120 [candidate division FCPU426 bacterium]|nr:hypothetical protein [candidate division FCPU426 bacterium]